LFRPHNFQFSSPHIAFVFIGGCFFIILAQIKPKCKKNQQHLAGRPACLVHTAVRRAFNTGAGAGPVLRTDETFARQNKTGD